jgi:hypothetical protein
VGWSQGILGRKALTILMLAELTKCRIILKSKLSIIGQKLTERYLQAAIIGFIADTILQEDQVLLADRAGQFSILNHAAC